MGQMLRGPRGISLDDAGSELLDRCRTLCVRLTIPFSLIEAEAVHRGVSVMAILRDYLVWKLKEANDA